MHTKVCIKQFNACKVFSETTCRSCTVRLTLKHFCYVYLKLTTHFMHSNKLTNKKQKIFSEKQEGFRDGLSYSTPQKSEETRAIAITQARSHPIPECLHFFNGTEAR